MDASRDRNIAMRELIIASRNDDVQTNEVN
jgi:hypothetical protein